MSDERRGMALDGVPPFDALAGMPQPPQGGIVVQPVPVGDVGPETFAVAPAEPLYGYVDWVKYGQLCRQLGLENGRLRIWVNGEDRTMEVASCHDVQGWAWINVPTLTHTDTVKVHGTVRLRPLETA